MNIAIGRLKDNPKFTLHAIIATVVLIAAIIAYGIVVVSTEENRGGSQDSEETTNEKTIEYLDCLHGYILVNSADGNRFTVKIDDNTL